MKYILMILLLSSCVSYQSFYRKDSSQPEPYYKVTVKLVDGIVVEEIVNCKSKEKLPTKDCK